MIRLLKVLSFIFSWFVPFGIVYVNHVALTESSYDVDMFGLLIVLAVLFTIIKRIENKIELWEIHKEHKVFILNWRNAKKVILLSGLTWFLFTIEDDMNKMQMSATLILITSVIGWLLMIIAMLLEKRKAKSNKKEVTQNE